MPRTEPNSLPSRFTEWSDWRAAYVDHVAQYNESNKGPVAELTLNIALERMGFYGALLKSEVTYIKGGGS